MREEHGATSFSVRKVTNKREKSKTKNHFFVLDVRAEVTPHDVPASAKFGKYRSECGI